MRIDGLIEEAESLSAWKNREDALAESIDTTLTRDEVVLILDALLSHYGILNGKAANLYHKMGALYSEMRSHERARH